MLAIRHKKVYLVYTLDVKVSVVFPGWEWLEVF
jgi:hypothetical protein